VGALDFGGSSSHFGRILMHCSACITGTNSFEGRVRTWKPP